MKNQANAGKNHTYSGRASFYKARGGATVAASGDDKPYIYIQMILPVDKRPAPGVTTSMYTAPPNHLPVIPNVSPESLVAAELLCQALADRFADQGYRFRPALTSLQLLRRCQYPFYHYGEKLFDLICPDCGAITQVDLYYSDPLCRSCRQHQQHRRAE